MKDKLKACPFCGSTNIRAPIDEDGWMCRTCGTESYVDWNRRPIEDALESRISELKAKIDNWQDCYCEFETIAPDGNLKISVLDLYNRLTECEARVAELEAENAELKGRAENAEQMVSRLLEVGSALEAQAYDAWIKDGMLDFPAAKDWELLINEIKETKKESEK